MKLHSSGASIIFAPLDPGRPELSHHPYSESAAGTRAKHCRRSEHRGGERHSVPLVMPYALANFGDAAIEMIALEATALRRPSTTIVQANRPRHGAARPGRDG